MTRFKAKRIDNGEWVFGWYIESPTFGPSIRSKNGMDYSVDPSTLHQEIGSEWYTMEEVEKLVAGKANSEVRKNTGEEGRFDFGEVDRESLRINIDRLMKCGWAYTKEWLEELREDVAKWCNAANNLSMENAQLKAEVERLKRQLSVPCNVTAFKLMEDGKCLATEIHFDNIEDVEILGANPENPNKTNHSFRVTYDPETLKLTYSLYYP